MPKSLAQDQTLVHRRKLEKKYASHLNLANRANSSLYCRHGVLIHIHQRIRVLTMFVPLSAHQNFCFPRAHPSIASTSPALIISADFSDVTPPIEAIYI